jgi:repressor LexA
VPQDLVGCADSDKLYALNVRGDSMIEDGINDGDIAIIKKTNHAENGEIVAASIGDSEDYSITLKHFYRVGDRYELHPANSQYKVMVSTHCEIYGKLLMIIRQYGR